MFTLFQVLILLIKVGCMKKGYLALGIMQTGKNFKPKIELKNKIDI